MYEVVDVLAKDVGVIGIFSDWPATVTYYANCMASTEPRRRACRKDPPVLVRPALPPGRIPYIVCRLFGCGDG